MRDFPRNQIESPSLIQCPILFLLLAHVGHSCVVVVVVGVIVVRRDVRVSGSYLSSSFTNAALNSF